MPSPPLSSAEFAALMAPLGPFEAGPLLAVAVSGGADSMALALLAGNWARASGGEAVALTVDHGLRPGSGAEAARVGRWLGARGMCHHILAWEGVKPAADIQAVARQARYRLLEDWCRANAALHLLVAHHREDQAETLLLRLGRGSGVDGLAAMPAVSEGRFARLLRPLLSVPRRRLVAVLTEAGQDWIEDPSNQNPAFARVRLRRLLPALAAEGITPLRLAATAACMGRARAALEEAVAQAAARWVTFHPAGFALADPAAFTGSADEVGSRLLARLLLAVGGSVHPPRLDRTLRLHGELKAGPGAARTLAGCRVVPGPDGVLFCREPGKVEGRLPLPPGAEIVWDGRFRLRAAVEAPVGLSVGALGVQGWRRVGLAASHRLPRIPAPARPTLPALYHEADICAVPHLGYNRDGDVARLLWSMVLAPPVPLTVAGHCLV